ncbi:MAG: FUSC family protein [Porticoccaceae bacterium]|nr:FUSC family protein [Porticoccaceae bacterium]
MPKTDPRSTERPRLWEHIKLLLALSDNKRSWGFLVVASMAVGLPVLVGAWLNHFSSSVIASMGGLVILYMQQTHIARRMMTLVVCSCGFAVSFSLGILTSFNPYLSAGTLALTVFLVTLTCRFYSLPPPGSFFFILVACMARTLPFDLTLAAERTGILLFGCMGACFLALIYSLAQVLSKSARPTQQSAAGDHRIAAITLEAAVISLFVGGGYLMALMMPLDNPYWVPISTAAILQGATFRAVWHRNVHRIGGTIIGMGLAWVIFSLSPNVWVLAGLIMLLSFLIEALVTRNYGLAVIFITPLTVIFADSTEASINTEQLILARLIDIMLGSSIGYFGGWVIHHPRIFYRLEQWLINR